MTSSLERAALSGDLTSLPNADGPDPDGREPSREDEEYLYSFEDLSVYEDHTQAEPCTDPDDQYRFLNSSQINTPGAQAMSRGWSGNTGPKGVLLDFKASHGKSGAILGGHDLGLSSPGYTRQLSMTSALASKRTLVNSHRSSSPASDSDSDLSSDREYGQTRRELYGSTKTTTRLTIPPTSYHRSSGHRSLSSSPNSHTISKVDSRGKKLFGHLREVGVENFIQAIESEKDDNETVVLVHLYDPALESCVILNHHLSNLARAHPRTKFLRALASELDFFSNSAIPTIDSTSVNCSSQQGVNLMDEDPFADDPPSCDEQRNCRATDSDVLPTLIWYRLGEYVESLPALERQMPKGGIVRGEQGCKELELLLKRNGIIHSSD